MTRQPAKQGLGCECVKVALHGSSWLFWNWTFFCPGDLCEERAECERTFPRVTWYVWRTKMDQAFAKNSWHMFLLVVDNECGSSVFSSSLWGGMQLNSPILQGSASKPARFALFFHIHVQRFFKCVPDCLSLQYEEQFRCNASRLKTHFLQVLAAVSHIKGKMQGFRLFRKVIVLNNQRRSGTKGITIYQPNEKKTVRQTVMYCLIYR